MLQKLKESYFLDYRSMALLRMSIALVMILNLVIRLMDLEVFYTNSGVLPLQTMFQNEWNNNFFSVNAMSGAWSFQLGIFLIGIIAALFVFVGYKTWWATLICWIILVSVDNRNLLIHQGGDDLICLVFFVGLFMPWNRRYSIDNLLNQYSTEGKTHKSLSGLVYLFLIAAVYLFSAILKSSPEWHSQGTALYYALSLDQLTWPFGRYLLQFPELLKVLSHLTLYLEIYAPILILLPFIHQYTRPIGILLIIALHIGISSMLFVGIFFIIGISSSIGCFPSNSMDWIENKSKRIRLFFRNQAQKLIVYFKLKANQNNPTLSENGLLVKEFSLFLIFAFFLSTNINSAKLFPYKMGQHLVNVGAFLHINQNWGMFAPSVFKDDGWYIYEATKATSANKDSLIDIYRNGIPVSYKKPTNVLYWIKNDRWRKYSENYLFVHKSYMRPALCQYELSKWNKNHPGNRIKKLQIIYMKEITQHPDSLYKNPTREMLCECY